MIDADGFIVAVHTTGGCHTSSATNGGVSMSSLSIISNTISDLIGKEFQEPFLYGFIPIMTYILN